MKLFWTYLVSLSIFLLGPLALAITNGIPISEEESPAVTFIEINDEGHSALCTGVVIGNGVILTAEHCAFVKNPESLRINKTLSVKRIFRPEVTENQERLDLAILEIEKDVLKSHLKIFNDVLPQIPQPISILGYGLAYLGDGTFAYDDTTVKRIGFNTLTPRNVTSMYIKINFDMGTNDPTKPAGALDGDSGGPMIYNNSVIGIASKSMFSSSYVNLTGNEAKKFLKAAEKTGFEINYTNESKK